MTSGSRGIHVVAPLRRTQVHDVVREQTREIAEELAARHPDRLTTEWRKNKREGRILIDTARNTYAQTTVAPYSVRAKPGAPVATPLRWEELEDPELRADTHRLGRCQRAWGATETPGGGARARLTSSCVMATAPTQAMPYPSPDLGVRVLSIARDDEPAPPPADPTPGASCT